MEEIVSMGSADVLLALQEIFVRQVSNNIYTHMAFYYYYYYYFYFVVAVKPQWLEHLWTVEI